MKVLVPISGGKDSQACLKFALLCHSAADVVGLFCDTQFEHPKTYAHIDWIEAHYGIRIDRVTGGSVLDKVKKYGRFPNAVARHCTDELKIRETRIYCKRLAEQQGGFEVWYGMRLNESHARKIRYADKKLGEVYPPHEVMPGKYPQYLAKLGVMFRLPILDWSTLDVLDFLNGEESPLYADGFDRVGCFPCLAAGDSHKKKAFQYDEFGKKQHQKVIKIASEIGKSVWTSKGIRCEVCSI